MSVSRQLRNQIESNWQPDENPAVVLCNWHGYSVARWLVMTNRLFRPYVFYHGKTTELLKAAIQTFSSDLRMLRPSLQHWATDYIHLATRYRCDTLPKMELTYLSLCACEAIDERVVWLSIEPRHRPWPIQGLAHRVAEDFAKSLRLFVSPDSPESVSSLARMRPMPSGKA